MTDEERIKWDEIVRINHDVPAILAADAEMKRLRKERDVYKDFINGYGNFPCHPDCDSISHSDKCPHVDIPLAFKNLQKENKRLREAVEWAIGDDTGDFYKCPHYLTWKRELHRRAKEGK